MIEHDRNAPATPAPMIRPGHRYDAAQGRCVRCNLYHTWPRRLGPPVSAANCPVCGLPLHRTTLEIAKRIPTRQWPYGLGVTRGEAA